MIALGEIANVFDVAESGGRRWFLERVDECGTSSILAVDKALRHNEETAKRQLCI